MSGGIEVRSGLVRRFVAHDGPVELFGLLIPADSRHGPRYLHVRRAAGNSETVVCDFLGNMQVGARRANRCELVTKISIESFKIFRQFDNCFSDLVQNRVVVIYVYHFGAVNGRMIEQFALGLERIVDQHGASTGINLPHNSDVTVKITCPTNTYRGGLSVHAYILRLCSVGKTRYPESVRHRPKNAEAHTGVIALALRLYAAAVSLRRGAISAPASMDTPR
jgi:hypothetical protein